MKGRFAPISVAACLAEAFGFIYDVAACCHPERSGAQRNEVEGSPSAMDQTSLKRKPSPLWGRWAIRFANWSDEGILPQGNTHRPVAFGESPHPSRRLCCYAKRNRSAIRQPSFKGNLCTQASRHLPHKGEGFRIAKRFCLTLGARSRAATLLSLRDISP